MKDTISFPSTVLGPIKRFLSKEEKELEDQDKVLTRDDPFSDTSRLANNASPDDDAAEQFGHARVEAMKRDINARLVEIKKALTKINVGKYGICENCGKMIDTDRLMVKPEATLCINCEKKKEK